MCSRRPSQKQVKCGTHGVHVTCHMCILVRSRRTLLRTCSRQSVPRRALLAAAPMFVAFSAPAALHGTREEILGTEAVWQTPPGTAKG